MTNKHTKRNSKTKSLLCEINVVPYIDVMLVLLIIFMITTPLFTQGININLPKANTASLPEQQATPIIVSVNARGNYYLNIAPKPTRSIALNSLTNIVSNRLHITTQKHETEAVLVKGDAKANYGAVIKAMAALQEVGAQHIGLITEPDGAGLNHK